MQSLDGMPSIGDSTDAHMEPNAAFSGSPHPDQEKQVMAAWARFLRGAVPPSNALRSAIEGSWSPSLSARVDPSRSPAPAPPRAEGLRTPQPRHPNLIDA